MDYIGIFDDVARALDFDEKALQRVVSNIDELRKTHPPDAELKETDSEEECNPGPRKHSPSS